MERGLAFIFGEKVTAMNEEIVLLSIPKRELETLIIDCVAAVMELHQPAREELPEWLTRKEVSKYLSCSLATVDNYSREGLLKKHYANGLPRFKREEVRQALEALA